MTTHEEAAEEAVNPTIKVLRAGDILADARNCIECVFMAASGLVPEEANPIQVVADLASKKIDEAIALLDEYRRRSDAPGHAPVAPSFTPAPRAKRKGK
jgi:hypothetical protein